MAKSAGVSGVTVPEVRMETIRSLRRFSGTSRIVTRDAEIYAKNEERTAKEYGRNILTFVIGDPWGVTVEIVERRRASGS